MRKIRKWIAALLAAVCLTVLTGCGQEEKVQETPAPMLTVYIPMDLENTCTVLALSDPQFAAKVEQTLGYRLDLQMLPSNMDYNEVALLDVSGILLTDDPAWVVPLAESRKIVAIDVKMEDFEYGQYNNSTYGYVLEDPSCGPRDVTILANLEAFRTLDISRVAFTPENVYDILLELKNHYRVPLAVSGMPTDAGFAPLLALFDMAPSGGREMYMDGRSVIYDKLSGAAGDYLSYLRKLYEQGLIPPDALELTEYSCAKLIAQNAAAMAVFTDEIYVSRAIEYARENNRELVTVTIPVAKEWLQTGIFSRVVGYVGKNTVSQKEAAAFFQMLQQAIRDIESGQSSGAADKLGQYILFTDYSRSEIRPDPREANTVYVYWLYQKEYLDLTYLDSVYCKILLGEGKLEELDAAARAWQEDSNLLGLIEGKYWAHIRDTE